MNWEVILTVLGSTSVIEGLKWLYQRQSRQRVAEAEADSAQVKAEEDEFHLKRERLQFADEQLLAKDKQLAEWSERHYEQTLLLREKNEQLLAKETELGEARAEIAELKAERKMKLCERRGCQQRQPQSGY